MAAVNVTFPGNLAQVQTAQDLRAIPSSLIADGDLYLVNGLQGLFEYDPGSVSIDDGTDVIRPYDKTPLQAGRWIRNVDGLASGPRGEAGPANSTYTTLTALKAAPTTNRSYTLVANGGRAEYAYVTGDFTDRADDVNVIKLDAVALSTGALVRQSAGSITFAQPAGVLQPTEVKLQRTIHVDDYRFAADMDDTNAFVRAVAAITATGGEILLDPKKRYMLSSTGASSPAVTIASIKPIAITGGVFGQVYDPMGPGIAITTPMSSVFRVQSPATRGQAGGIAFRNISFVDATGSGGVPGTNTISRALLDLYDAPHSLISGCQFHFIKGSVIRTDFFVQSRIYGLTIRYSGVLGKRVVDLNGTDTSYATQAVTVDDCRIEVCYGDVYFYTSPLTQSVTLSRIQFEAATTEYPASNVPYLDFNTDEGTVLACGFNRNTAATVSLGGGRSAMIGCRFSTGASGNPSILITGARYLISGCTFTDLRTGSSIRVVGINNLIVGNRFYQSGGVSLEGAGNQFLDNIVDYPSQTGGGYLIVLADFCTARGNYFVSTDGAPAVNAIVLYGPTSTATHNSFRSWSAKTAIRVEANGAVYMPNRHDGVGTFVTSSVQLVPVVASAPSISLGTDFDVFQISGSTQINQINGGMEHVGRRVVLVFQGAVTVGDTNNLKLTTNFTSTADDTLSLACDGNNWYEIARSAN